MFFLGWGRPSMPGHYRAALPGLMTYSSYGGNKPLEDKIQTAVTSSTR